MKKFIFGLILLPFALSINAQKGMHSVGANVSYNIFNNKLADYGYWDGYSIEQDNKFGLGLKYQYYVTNYFRFSCSIKGVLTGMDVLYDDYEEYGYHIRGVDVSLDSHWFITRPSRLRPYGIIGLSTGCIKNTFDYDDSYLGINYGAGIQYETNNRITLQMEIIGRYGFPRASSYDGEIERPFDNFQISIGAVYNI